MKSTVIVAGDQLGNVVGTSKNNPEFGYIRVTQKTHGFTWDGWLKLQNRSALIKGRVEELEQLGYKVGQEVPGKIVVREQLVPFNANNPQQDLKLAGESGIPCTVDDQPIYRNSFFTLNEDDQDQLIQHDNTEAIRQHQQAGQKLEDAKL